MPRRKALPCVRENHYVGFVDPSGGVHDAMVLSIAHQESSGRCILDKLAIDRAALAVAGVAKKTRPIGKKSSA